MCAAEEMAAAHAGAAKSSSAGGAALPPGRAAEAAGNSEWIPALHRRSEKEMTCTAADVIILSSGRMRRECICPPS